MSSDILKRGFFVLFRFAVFYTKKPRFKMPVIGDVKHMTTLQYQEIIRHELYTNCG